MFNVLLVDDSPVMRQWVARSLAMTEFKLEIHQAENGRHALEQVRSLRPDLIITDLHMPELTGDELVWALAADEVLRHIPVLILTADSERSRAEELNSRSTVLACLRKPVSPEDLRKQLERLISTETKQLSNPNTLLEQEISQ